MNTMALSALWTYTSASLTRRLAIVLGLMLLTLMLLSPSMTAAYAGLGGYISEKLLADNATPDASLYLGDSADAVTVIASVPFIDTLPASNIISSGGVASATLRGNLANLNGMPEADVWFVWGYSPAALSNTTATAVETTTGIKTVNITGMDIGVDVFYQFRSSTDGIATGGILSFLSGGAHGTSYWLLTILLPVIVAAVILITVLKLTGNPVAALIAAVIGLITFIIVQQIGGIL